MSRRLNLILLALLLAIGLPSYWLLFDNRPGDNPAKPLHIAELRMLAASLPGPAPSGVESELVASRHIPGTLFAAGSGLKQQLLGIMAFRLPVPGGAPVVIDSGMPQAVSDEMGMEKFYPEAQARVNAALRQSGIILITHEHADHLGGVVGLGDKAMLAKVRFNRDQLPGNRWTDLLRWPQGPLPAPSIAGPAPVAVAPGVVVIPAPSHTPGSQMVFVRLGDGREFLFAGDIATMAQSWTELRARSRLIGDWLAPEQRGEVFAWLRTIRALKAEAPRLEVIAGHDFERIDDHKGRRGIRKGFQP